MSLDKNKDKIQLPESPLDIQSLTENGDGEQKENPIEATGMGNKNNNNI